MVKLIFRLALAHVVVTWIHAIWRGYHARIEESSQISTTSSERPFVSIIIPAWNERGTIEECIRSLRRLDYQNWEALILAGGSDGTYEATQGFIIDDDRFRVLERGPEPKNAAIAKGIAAARHDILVILDADSRVESVWLSELIRPVEDGAAASFGMHYPSQETWVSMAEQMSFIQEYQVLGSKMGAGCSSLAIQRKTLKKIGPLPENAFSWEDWDIAVRLLDIKETIAFAPQARLLTDRPVTLSEYWSAAIRSYRSHIAGVWHHRKHFLRHPRQAITELFFLVYGATLTLIAFGALVAVIARPTRLPVVSRSAGLLAIWILGRRATLGIEVATATQDAKWIGWSLAPVAILPVQFFGAAVAVVTAFRQPSFDYKGPRFKAETDGYAAD